MATDTSTGSEFSITGLLRGILADAQELALHHVALIRSELAEAIQQTKSALVLLAAGLALVQVAVFLFAHVFAMLLLQWMPDLPAWGAYAIVGGLLAVVGAIPLAIGIMRLNAVNPAVGKHSEAQSDFPMSSREHL